MLTRGAGGRVRAELAAETAMSRDPPAAPNAIAADPTAIDPATPTARKPLRTARPSSGGDSNSTTNKQTHHSLRSHGADVIQRSLVVPTCEPHQTAATVSVVLVVPSTVAAASTRSLSRLMFVRLIADLPTLKTYTSATPTYTHQRPGARGPKLPLRRRHGSGRGAAALGVRQANAEALTAGAMRIYAREGRTLVSLQPGWIVD